MTNLNPIGIVKLDNWQAIQVSGSDTVTYLNSQITCDLASFDVNQASFGCHCDAKGKTWAQFYLMPVTDSDNAQELTKLLFQHKSTLEKSASELKKFGVFSKVSISERASEYQFYAILGDISETISPTLTQLHHVSELESGFICKIASDLHLLIQKIETQLPSQFDNILSRTLINENDFEAALIQSVLPFITDQHQGDFVPQMLNAHALNGISFKKGCYMGQETVARMRYLGKNKRACFAFSTQATDVNLGDMIEIQEDSSWRRAGEIIQITKQNDTIFGLAVMSSEQDKSAAHRIKNTEIAVNINPLPYSLDY